MRKLIPWLLGAAALAIVGVLVVGGSDKKYIVYAKFDDAGGILKNYNVKVGQVAAGHVSEITLDEQDHAVVKMELDNGSVPLGSGATAKVRPVNLLGEKYIDLSPGDLARPVASGTTIPVSKTGSPIELDDALNILDPDTRGALRIIINEAGLTMAGRGTDFNRTLTDLPPALDSARRVVSEIEQENGRLRSLITQGDRVLTAVAPKADDLGDLVSSAADALQTAAQRRDALGRTVAGAPAALGQLRTTLAGLQEASTQLSPAADDLLATSPQLAETLTRLPQFAKDAGATLDEVTRVAPQLGKLGRRSAPTLRRLRPTAVRLAQFSSDLAPLLDQSYTSVKSLVGGFVNGWAGVTNNQDGLGHYWRLQPGIDTALATSVLERELYKPKVAAKAKPGKPAAANKPAPEVTAPAAPAAAPPRLLEPLKPVVGAVNDALNGLKGGLDGSGDKTSSGGNEMGKLLNYLLGP
ncbi:MAG: hypothetical protein JWN65_1472 [Solirubrobacterales bacterium]|nr:hypothetical protein [Solirubrobacterales bacterium]